MCSHRPKYLEYHELILKIKLKCISWLPKYYLSHMELFQKKIYLILPCYMTWKHSKRGDYVWKTSMGLRLWELEAKYIIHYQHKQLAFHCSFPHEIKPWFANICDTIACLRMLSPTTLLCLPQLVKIMIPLAITQDHKMIYGGIDGNVYM